MNTISKQDIGKSIDDLIDETGKHACQCITDRLDLTNGNGWVQWVTGNGIEFNPKTRIIVDVRKRNFPLDS